MPANTDFPAWAVGEFVSVTRTGEELSVVCLESAVPDGVKCERAWRVLRVAGPLDFALIGVLATLLAPLADAAVSVFCVSTFDTDYLLVKEEDVNRAIEAMEAAGHRVAEGGD